MASPLLAAAPGKMTFAMHQTTSAGAGYRGSLEGWARAGVTQAEVTYSVLAEFLKSASPADARQILTDNGLTLIQAAVEVNGLCEPPSRHPQAHAELHRRCELFASLGAKHIYATTMSTATPTAEDLAAAPQHLYAAGEIARQHNLQLRIEFLRNSPFVSTLPTILKLTRAAAHPNLSAMFDFYHFLTGLSKMEDLDAVRPGEITHVHIQDVPDIPRELLNVSTRLIPGDGIAPLATVLRKLAGLGYAGPLSVELFLPEFQQGDPFRVASEIRRKTEAVMRQAL